jgi:hypothetical protein
MSQLRRATGFFVAFVLGCSLTALLMGRPSVGQVGGQTTETSAVAGRPAQATRYVMHVGGNLAYVVVFDSATGQCWSKAAGSGSDAPWNVLGSPVPAKK